MGYLNLLLRFLRLGPLALGAIAVGLLVAGYFLQVASNESDAERAAALRVGPPEAVSLGAFDRDVHQGLAGEVVIEAQPFFDMSYELVIQKDGPDSFVYMVPLLAPDATSYTDVLGIAYFPTTDAGLTDAIDAVMWPDNVSDYGKAGPIVAYNGELKGMGQWDDLTAEALTDQGLTLADDPVILWPYLQGREAALAPPAEGSFTIFGLLSKLAGVIGLLALGKLAIRNDGGTPPPVVEEAAHIEPQEPVQAPAQYMVEEDLSEPARTRRFGIRGALIGIVGLAFVVLLGSVVWGLIQESGGGAETVAVTSSQDLFANTVADAVVPDADPNRHWTDIDVTPIVEWFVAKGVLAATGDIDAIKSLAMVFGGVIGGVLVLWWFFAMRRSLTPKTTARIDSMGL